MEEVEGMSTMAGLQVATRPIASATLAPQIPDARLIELYATMVRSRCLDERTWILNRQGRAPFTISCQGHEAAQVGSAFAFEPGRDVVFPYYRDVGVVLTFGMTPRELMLAFLARP